MCSPLPNQAEQESRTAGYAPLRVDMDNPDAVRDMQIVAAYIAEGLSARKAAKRCGVSDRTVRRVMHRLGDSLLSQLSGASRKS